jgi:hypothetical protein
VEISKQFPSGEKAMATLQGEPTSKRFVFSPVGKCVSPLVKFIPDILPTLREWSTSKANQQEGNVYLTHS